jgi:hypothetical protein
MVLKVYRNVIGMVLRSLARSIERLSLVLYTLKSHDGLSIIDKVLIKAISNRIAFTRYLYSMTENYFLSLCEVIRVRSDR